MGDAPQSALSIRFYEEAHDWLERRAAGEPGVEAALAAWLLADPRHRAAFAVAQEVWAEGALIEKGTLGFDGKLQRASFRERRPLQFGIASAAAIALAGLGTAWLSRNDLFPQIVAPANAAAYETRLGEIRTFRLEDATAITLDTDTRVEVSLSRGTRHIEIVKGRLRVESPPDSAAIVVTAGKTSATVVGDLFDADVTGASLRITAPRAAIELSAADPATGTPRSVASGSQVEIGTKSPAVRASRSDLEWVSGMLALDGNRLGDAVAAINRYNTTRISLASTSLGALKISGAFRATDPDGFAEAVAKLLDLKVTRPNAASLVLSPP